MNLSTKAVILLVLFNRVEYSTAEDEANCGTKAFEGLDVDNCANSRFGISSNGIFGALGNAFGGGKQSEDKAEDKDKNCCHQYYHQCLAVKFVREKCSPSSKWTDEVKAKYKETLKLCTPTKELCAKYYKDVEEKCAKYDNSECKSYTWSSFTPISVNGWALCLLIFISVLFVV